MVIIHHKPDVNPGGRQSRLLVSAELSKQEYSGQTQVGLLSIDNQVIAGFK